MDANTELWAVTYLHDWDPDGKIYPQVHSIHERWEDAETERKTRISPEKYWVTRARFIPTPVL
jgi:hypothetical protein